MELNCAVMIMCVGNRIYDLHRCVAKSRLYFAVYLRDEGTLESEVVLFLDYTLCQLLWAVCALQ